MKLPKYHRILGYNLSLLPYRHLASLEEGVTGIEQARKRSGLTVGYPGWGLLYILLLTHLDRGRREVIVETGTNWGCATLTRITGDTHVSYARYASPHQRLKPITHRPIPQISIGLDSRGGSYRAQQATQVA